MKYLASISPATRISPPGGVPTLEPGSLNEIITLGVNVFLLMGIITALFVIFWGGYIWMTSEGDKQKLDMARRRLWFAIWGLLVMFLAMFFVNLVGLFFGSPFFSN